MLGPLWQILWPHVSLDVVLLALSLVAFFAGIAAFLYQEVKVAAEPRPPVAAESLQPAKKIAEDTETKAREDLPEPEPEGCDEEGKKFVEVNLERIPGEAWGLCWQRTAFDEERLIFAGVDPNSPAGRWQHERSTLGLPLVQPGDELMSVNDLSQHSCMKMSLVVSNRLRLKFLRSGWVVPGDLPHAEKCSEKCSEKCPEECSKPEASDNEAVDEDDIDDAEGYDGLQLNFWSYQRPPREAAQVRAPSPSPHLRAQSEPRERAVRESSREDAEPKGSARSRSRTRQSQEAAHGRDSQIFSGCSDSDAQCPSTDWEYMMDNRAGQACTAAANGNVVLMAGSHAYALPAGSLPSSMLPCGMLPVHMPDMSQASEVQAVAGGMAPFNGFQGMYPTPASGSGAVMGWNYWQDQPMGMVPPQEAMHRANSPRSKKTYRAGQRLTARRSRAAQRAEQAEAPSGSEDASEAVAEGARTKPRRRAGVRVRRRREHALRRREEQQAEPLPPGLRDATAPAASRGHEQATGPTGATSRHQDDHCEETLEGGIIGEKVLINAAAAHLNGHWGQVIHHDEVRQRYAVQVLGTGATLLLRREEMVLPKTSPPRPEELRGKWHPNLRM